MSKFTQGPWVVKKEVRTNRVQVESKFGYHICEVSNQPKDSGDGSNEANAQLIAVAPDLLEIAMYAKNLMKIRVEQGNGIHGYHTVISAVDQILEKIRKAEDSDK